MDRVERTATQGFVASISMPLLTELVSIKDGFGYKHGAPDGAVPTRQHGNPTRTPKNTPRIWQGGRSCPPSSNSRRSPIFQGGPNPATRLPARLP
jgi:hypothetical protein